MTLFLKLGLFTASYIGKGGIWGGGGGGLKELQPLVEAEFCQGFADPFPTDVLFSQVLISRGFPSFILVDTCVSLGEYQKRNGYRIYRLALETFSAVAKILYWVACLSADHVPHPPLTLSTDRFTVCLLLTDYIPSVYLTVLLPQHYIISPPPPPTLPH